MKLMIEALLYNKLAGGRVQCKTCSHRCLIDSGSRGLCQVRANHEGVLYSLNYGLAIASAIDPIEKKPLYHFLPNTEIYSFAAQGCNLHCPWCQNYEISQSSKRDGIIAGDPISPREHVERALRFKCPSIAYTYSEPTIFLEYALATMKIVKENNLKNVWVTNGFMSEETLALIIPYLDAVNVDIKGPDDRFYREHCGGSLKPIIANLKVLQKAHIHIEIATLLIPDLNDKREDIEEIASIIVSNLGTEIPWHVTRFFPAWKMLHTKITPLAILEMARDIGEHAGIKHIHIGNV